MKKPLCLAVLLVCFAVLQAQERRCRIYFADKAPTTHTLDNPHTFMSDAALARRARQQLPVDSTDIPVCTTYIEQVEACGTRFVTQSAWNNTIVVQCADTAALNAITKLPFVARITPVWQAPDSVPKRVVDREKKITDATPTQHDDPYGAAATQVKMLGVDHLHAAGFRGEGMKIAVLDGGFQNTDLIPLLRNVDIIGTANMVNDEDIYQLGTHGTMVLSCMAANEPHVMIGTAPAAQYMLFVSEDMDTEQPIEEDFWAAAIELADQWGADLVNSSLGYNRYDNKADHYTYRQLDGNTALISRTASMAAAKGMVVVSSAGNDGRNSWKKISVPADADNILTVGAVDEDEINTPFSAVGNTADGRIKPDVMAMGGDSAIIDAKGAVRTANGTSFSAPTLCGAIACLWQSRRDLTAKQLIEAVRQAGNRIDFPDNIYGYGVPKF